MRRILLAGTFIIFLFARLSAQQPSDTTVYLITCGPGTETYSIYGHSALRVVITGEESDNIYNWGVFDFSTPNFAWKFAKGRLEYMLDMGTARSFLQNYMFERRFVLSQKINLNSSETQRLLSLIRENLKPENISYRYDFFYDDCSTRIRDLLEVSIGDKLLYPPDDERNITTFRKMVGKYQSSFPWLNFGIDLIMGSPGDKKALFRDRMFLPLDMQKALEESVINRNGKMIPLLQNPEVILDFEPSEISSKLVTTPVFVFAFILIIIIILSALYNDKKFNKIMDIAVFSVFSVLSLMMIFFNFFTDHQQMKWNLNIIWLNPFILLCVLTLILNKNNQLWFRMVFYISGAFIVLNRILPQEFSISFMMLAAILLIRSSVRSGFEWNPFSLR